MEVIVTFVRNNTCSGEGKVEVGSVFMDSGSLPQRGDYIQVPLSENWSFGSEVLTVSRKYKKGTYHSRLCVFSLRLEEVEVQVR